MCRKEAAAHPHLKTVGEFEIKTSVCWNLIVKSLLFTLNLCQSAGTVEKPVQGLKMKPTSAPQGAAAVAHT